MEKEKFTTLINAPREKVWEVLWGDDTYGRWTELFSEGSRAETDWEQGSKVLFLNGENEGMISLVERKVPHEIMSFKHLGFVDKDGNEDTESEKVKPWAGSMETYYLRPVDGKTELTVEMDLPQESKKYFAGIWPKVFERLKELSEQDRKSS